MTKLKNSNCDKTQIVRKSLKLKSDKTQIVTKVGNSNFDKTQKLKLWQNLKTKIGTKLEICKNLNLWRPKKLKKGLLVRTFWHLDNRWDVLWAAFCDSRDVFKWSEPINSQSMK